MLDSERPTWPQAISHVPDLDDTTAAGAPPVWPAPWEAPARLPWWRRLWAHGQGAWIGAAAGALLVVGLLCAGATAHLPTPGSAAIAGPRVIPIARHATTLTTARHPAAKPVATAASARVVSLSVSQPTTPTTSTHTKPAGHGKHHK